MEAPNTVNDGGFLGGKWIVWLNLEVTRTEATEQSPAQYQSTTQRLALTEKTLTCFLEAVDPSLLLSATDEECEAVLRFFEAEDDVEAWRAIRAAQVKAYDRSEAVNRFSYDGTTAWFDKSARVGLMNSLTIEKESGRTTTTLWLGARKVELSIACAHALLTKLELYSLSVYNTTATHLSTLPTLSVEELKVYRYKASYPDSVSE